jgi:HK97 family phage major capsid protein
MDNNKVLTQEQFEKALAESLTNAMTKTLPDAVGVILGEKLKEMGIDKMEAKFKNLPPSMFGASQEDLSKMDGKQKAAKFIKALFKKDLATLASIKAMNETTGSAGGYTVPQEWATEIDRVVTDFGLLRKIARVVPMTRDVMNMPTLGTYPTVYWPGEATAGTASSPVLASPTLTAKTLVGLTSLSNELLEDSNVNLTEFLAEIIGEQIAGEEDNQGLAGTGSPFTGVLQDSTVTTYNVADDDLTITGDELRSMIGNLKPTLLPGALWVMHRSIWAGIQKLTGNSQYLVSLAIPVIGPNVMGQVATAGQGGFAGAFQGTIWGYPVLLSEKMPAFNVSSEQVSTPFIIFGNFKKFYFGDRKQLTMDISSEATVGSDNLFAANMSAVRIIERIGETVGIGEAFVVGKSAAS